MIEICKKSPDEARQGPVPDEYEHSRARGEKVLVRPSQAKTMKGKVVIIGEEWLSMMIKPKSPKDGQWQKNEGAKPQ
jgi:hypothetical protein